MATVELAKVELTLNQPIYSGCFKNSDFCYSYTKRKYPDSRLLSADTGSPTYQSQMDKM